MTKLLRPAISLFIVLSILTGIAYPLIVMGIGQLLFPDQVSGSVLLKEGKPLGSSLLGQNFTDPKYFWGRLSATSPQPYRAAASSGSNLGPLNPALLEAVKGRIATLKAADPSNPLPIPVDLVTASASGLDPHISPAAAEYQINRVAKARHLTPQVVRELVEQSMERRQLGILGEPRVNVLKLNLALEEQHRN